MAIQLIINARHAYGVALLAPVQQFVHLAKYLLLHYLIQQLVFAPFLNSCTLSLDKVLTQVLLAILDRLLTIHANLVIQHVINAPEQLQRAQNVIII